MSRHFLKHAAVVVFFLVFLGTGLKIAGDYGIGWDEQAQRKIGAVTVKYLAEIFAPSLISSREDVLPALHAYPDKYYGVAFEAPLAALEAVLGLEDERLIFLLRHILTFFVCFLGVWSLYGLAARRFRDWRIGLLTALFMVLSPRFFAESFYNSKDAVFLAVFTIALSRAVAFILKPNVKTALLFALAAAFAIDVRVMGVILPVIAAGFVFLRVVKGELPVYRTFLMFVLFSAVTGLGVIALWPYLWIDPAGNFLEAIKVMSRFPWDNELLYQGEFIKAKALPWHYLPVWIGITTPLLYLGLFVTGAIVILRKVFLRGACLWKNNAELQDLFFLAVFLGPVLSAVFFHFVLYDGWRQMYFVYSAFLLIAIRGWYAFWGVKKMQALVRGVLIIVTVISFFHVGEWMRQAHPMQNVYFNLLAGRDVIKTYEMDYWGLGNRIAMEYILKNDPSPMITIVPGSTTPLKHTIFMLDPKDRARVILADDKSNPYYVINNYRLVRDKDGVRYQKDYDLFYQLKVGGELVLSVFKLKTDMKEY